MNIRQISKTMHQEELKKLARDEEEKRILENESSRGRKYITKREKEDPIKALQIYYLHIRRKKEPYIVGLS